MEAVPPVEVVRPDGARVLAEEVLGAALRGQQGVAAPELGHLNVTEAAQKACVL